MQLQRMITKRAENEHVSYNGYKMEGEELEISLNFSSPIPTDKKGRLKNKKK